MISLKLRGGVGVVLFAALVLNGSWAAESTRTQSGKVAPAKRPAIGKAGTARGPLPDPVLLDGSTHPPEKKSEYGMIGDFELPGDENAKQGRVGGGGPQNPGQQQNQNAGGMPMGLPQGGGAAGKQAQSEKAGAAGSQAASEAPPGQQNANAAGEEIQGAGDPNAKAEGIQVAELQGEGSGDQQGAAGEKPPPVAIGDSAMQIQTAAKTPGVVGGQQLPQTNTQQHEKGTGTGGKGPTGTQGPGRIEKGRTIPAGL
jgi:hypothetical protein